MISIQLLQTVEVVRSETKTVEVVRSETKRKYANIPNFGVKM